MSADEPDELLSERLDKWLWAARFYKTRSLAAEAIDGGKVDVNGERAKRSRLVRVGDRLAVRKPPYAHDVVIHRLTMKRGSGAAASTMYDELPESRRAREALAAQLRSMGPPVFREQGKPSKKERRAIDKFRRRGE